MQAPTAWPRCRAVGCGLGGEELGERVLWPRSAFLLQGRPAGNVAAGSDEGQLEDMDDELLAEFAAIRKSWEARCRELERRLEVARQDSETMRQRWDDPVVLANRLAVLLSRQKVADRLEAKRLVQQRSRRGRAR